MDILAEGSCSAMHRAIYTKLRKMDPSQMPKNSHGRFAIIKQIMIESYSKARSMMKEEIENADDPLKRKKYEKGLEEIDGVFNLLSSVDEKSSEKYMFEVMANVAVSMDKLADLRNFT